MSDVITVCPHCGTDVEAISQALTARDERIAILEQDCANLERELRGKRARIRQLQAEADRRLQNNPLYDDAMKVLEHWKKKCMPAARELGGKRLDNVIARLKGSYTVDDLKKAIDGYALKPYVVNGKRSTSGTREEWYADAELIFREPSKVDLGIRIAEREQEYREVMQSRQAEPVHNSGELGILGTYAVRYARIGWLVLPIKARDKVPATSNGLHDARRDEQAIIACWLQYPNLNVGIRTGAESGIVVIDIDGDEGYESLSQLEKRYGIMPVTASVKTPRGGQHLYFRHPGVEVRNAVALVPGIDFRGDGGYVLAPPSIGPTGRPYEVDEEAPIAALPEWFLKGLQAAQKPAQAIGSGRDWAQFVRDGATQGERDNRMTQFVGHLYAHGHKAGEVLEHARLLNQRVNPPLADRDLARIVASIAKAEARRAA